MDHRVLLTERIYILVRRVRGERIAAIVINGMIAAVIVIIVVLVPIIVSRFLEFLGHWWEGNALWQVW